jgi:hypothetical protein
MSRYAEDVGAVPQDEGLRGVLARLESSVQTLEDHLETINGRLFGNPPQPVSTMPQTKDAAPPILRTAEALDKRLSEVADLAHTIRNRL